MASRNPPASLAGVLEELGELSHAMPIKEGFKRGAKARVDYALAEVLFELLKLAEDCGVDLESAFVSVLERWAQEKPTWTREVTARWRSLRG